MWQLRGASGRLIARSHAKVASEGADLFLLIGAKPRTKGMERKNLIRDNGPIFVGQGKAIQEVASKDVRVVVVGNPCNTNCLIAMHHGRDIPRQNELHGLPGPPVPSAVEGKRDSPVGDLGRQH